MSKLLKGIHSSRVERDPDVANWNAAVRRELGPFVRRKSILSRYREILRTELMNLRKIESNLECMKLLLRLVRLYRRELTVDPVHSLQQLIALFPGTVTADENWMSLFMRAEQPSSKSIQDVVHAQVDWMDVVLEGCHKYHFRTFYAFALRNHSGRFPTGVIAKNYGALVGGLPKPVRSEFCFLCEDPEHHIPVNQWRNIAAHKSFVLRSSRTLDVTYGRDPNQVTLRITTASLRRTLDWSIQALNTLRLASVIVYLEFMTDLHEAGLPEPTLRLDSWLTHLFHNLRLVGFFGLSHCVKRDIFTIDLIDTQRRPVRDAIIHASQVLDQMSVALDSDPTVRPRPERAEVRLVDDTGAVVAGASVKTADALAHSEGKSTLEEYIACVDFVIPKTADTQQGKSSVRGRPHR